MRHCALRRSRHSYIKSYLCLRHIYSLLERCIKKEGIPKRIQEQACDHTCYLSSAEPKAEPLISPAEPERARSVPRPESRAHVFRIETEKQIYSASGGQISPRPAPIIREIIRGTSLVPSERCYLLNSPLLAATTPLPLGILMLPHALRVRVCRQSFVLHLTRPLCTTNPVQPASRSFCALSFSIFMACSHSLSVGPPRFIILSTLPRNSSITCQSA
jgi:hypothetical protein